MPKKYWIVVRNRHEFPSKNRSRFKRHKTLAEAVIEAQRLCEGQRVEAKIAPSFRVFECIGELKKTHKGKIVIEALNDRSAVSA